MNDIHAAPGHTGVVAESSPLINGAGRSAPENNETKPLSSDGYSPVWSSGSTIASALLRGRAAMDDGVCKSTTTRIGGVLCLMLSVGLMAAFITAMALHGREPKRTTNSDDGSAYFPCLPGTARNPPSTVKPVRTMKNDLALRFAVESRVFPEAPNVLFVTQRGGTGLSIWDIGPPHEDEPQLLSTWRPENGEDDTGETDEGDEVTRSAGCGLPIEGIDRIGDIAVVSGLGSRSGGGIFTLNVSDPRRPTQLGYTSVVAIDGAGPSLHVGLYRAPIANRTFAILAMGWYNWTRSGGAFIGAVEVTDPANPVFLSQVNVPAACPEGMVISGDYAYVGANCSNDYVSVRLDRLVGLPPIMHIEEAASSPSFVQLAGALYLPPADGCSSPSANTGAIFAASWAAHGGLLVFADGASNKTMPGSIQMLGSSLSNETGYANRVRLHIARGLAVAPLEHHLTTSDHDGGFALYDITHLHDPRLLLIHRIGPSTTTFTSSTSPAAATRVFCATFSPSGRYLYVFGADDHTMRVYDLGPAET